ncbi:orotate phosphoribosyltransferase [Sinimarinibacterium sp. NLF-5-8]|uniref:orotate phosphoribosyltransferase n=1 Tax=Sinimarinibacterium sp. NLF-5-8 TaxID=2698684 RepID=UPI00137BB33C|nr:orotate phosphoribosyltransferase [Sinimarinibacterium sp. NLF-5-8]QHS10691.1 orotate phosphoribosyltransferase [Sinimarinibacterium sp. NLF-5-8]
MKPYQTAFIELALAHQVLKFGEFTLKSGRISPYFFNLGQIASGAAMRRLAHGYAQALTESGVEYDMLFGPAYKGIPLVTAIASALAEDSLGARDVPFAYNRKEAKDHGEGGTLVGAPPRGRVVIVDDVLTAGTALRQAVQLLRDAGAEPVAAVIALDRQECGNGSLSAVQEMERDTGVRVIPLVTVDVLLDYLSRGVADAATLDAIRAYQRQYGISAA